ncbi:MAG TPA: cytochrome c biogenesis protein CcsA [Candidatus Methylomirabilis sp.]|nr:cytochrome c biogenesis protein CcsA [Candidatus Methylomirabilis sp.]
MNAGNLLVYTSLICVLLGAISMFKGKVKTGKLLTGLAAATSTISVIWLCYAFISLNFDFFYVWRFASEEMPVFYRVFAMVIGQEGTFLIWAWLSIVAVFFFMEIYWTPDRAGLLTLAYSLSGCAFLLILTLIMTPFNLISGIQGSSLPSVGNSINPALLDFLMPAHIFTVFLSYAFVLVPAAASLSYLTILRSGKLQPEVTDIKNYLRLSWLFLSIGMITGGIWANRLLGWTGFWQWDPIQSTVMAVWLLLTAALHAIVRSKSDEYRILLPLLCIGTFLSAIYTTLVARSGIFSSIHSFPSTPTSWILAAFMFFLFCFTLILITGCKEQEVKKTNIRAGFSPHNTFYFTIIILLAMSIISLWGPSVDILFSFLDHRALSPEFYNMLLFPLIIALSFLAGICILYGKVKDRTLAYAAFSYFIVCIAVSITVPGNNYSVVPQDGINVNFFENVMGSVSIISYLPVFFFVTVSVIWKAIKDLKLKSTTAVLHLAGINMIHLGFIFVVMGAAISSSFATTYVFSYPLDEKGPYMENGGIGIRLLDYRVEKNGNDWDQVVDIELNYGKKSNISTSFRRSNKFGIVTNPAVRYGLFSDVTVEFQGSIPHQIQNEIIELNVKKQPLISILWGGCILLLAGVVLTLSSDYMRRKKRT